MTDTAARQIHRASLLMMASVFLSRIIGFIREWVLANTVGASALTDVYYASFTIPDFLNHLMAAGALSISFVPLLSKLLAEKQEEFARRFFRFLTTSMGVILIGLIIVTEIWASSIARLIAPGFSVEQISLLTTLIRIILPGQLFFYWGGLAIAVQYTHGKFLIPAIAPLVYNLGIILCGVLLEPSLGVKGFSVGVLVGSFVSHGLLQIYGVGRLGYSIRPYFEWNREIQSAFKKYMWLTIPITLGFSLVVADEWLIKYFASGLEPKGLSWLSYARTEMRIPIAIIGQAAGIASFPFLARLWSENKYREYSQTLLREIQKLWALAPLAAIVFYDHALPITHFIYGGSKLSQTDLLGTAQALRMFSLGIVFWTMQMILSRGFYATQKTWLPSLLGTGISFALIPLYKYLASTMGHEGLALAGSVGILLYCVVLSFFLILHIKKHDPTFHVKGAAVFFFFWSVYLIGVKIISQTILTWGIYEQTRLSAFFDIILCVAVVVGVSWVLLRTVFVRLTQTPLY